MQSITASVGREKASGGRQPPEAIRGLLLIIVVALSATALGCQDSRVAKLYGGEETLTALQSAKSINALRIDPKKYNPKLTGDQVLFGYPITSEPVNLSADQIKALTAVLIDPGTYSFDSAKGCEFMPGVALSTTANLKDGKSNDVVILLCFTCNELEIYVGGKKVGYEDTDHARGKLLALAKQLFPVDKEVQSLK